MNLNYIVGLFALLQIKHFVCDFLYQPAYMWKNKGTFGHWGGLAHSGFHAFATLIILGFLPQPHHLPPGEISYLVLALVAVEFVIHYLVDWSKMNINAHFGWGATTHSQFWIFLGVDQLAHQLTYCGIVYIMGIAWQIRA